VSRFGLRGTVLAWIKSYLTNRSQAVVIKDVHSFSAKLTCGVPKGSVLGPLLFSLYVAPIEDIIIAHSLQSMIFADDTQMYLVIQRSEQSSCLSKLELCAQDILSWMANDKFLFGLYREPKTGKILFGIWRILLHDFLRSVG